MYSAAHIYMDDVKRIESASKKNLRVIEKAVQSADSEVRQDAFKKLSLFKFDNDIKHLLIKGINDPDRMIRSDCIEVLGEFDLPDSLDLIINALQDTSHYVVHSAILALTELETAEDKAISVLQEMLKKDNLRNGTIARIRYALYILDPDYSVDHVLDCLIDSRDYADRCAILNMLWECCYEEDAKHVLQRVQELINPNDFRAVLSCLEDLKKELEAILTTEDQ